MESRLTDEDIDWKLHFERIMTNMNIQQLNEAIRRRDITELQRVYRECRGAGLTPRDAPQMSKARQTIDILNMGNKLNEAIATGEMRTIQNELETVEDSGFAKYLGIEITRAKYALQSLERQQHVSMTHVPDLNRSTMSEIRRYKNPSPELHCIIQAVLLLLGHDEGTTSGWKACQQLCNPQGRNGLVRKLAQFEIGNLNMEIVARVKQILSKLNFMQVQAMSAGASTFFVWAKGIVDEIEGGSHAEGQTTRRRRASQHPTNPLTDVEPADIKRQVEIFSRVTPDFDQISTSTPEVEEKEVSSPRSSKRETPRNTKASDAGRLKSKMKKLMMVTM